MATITATSKSGTYNIGSEKGQDFVKNAAAGSTMTGGDGSTWTKNSDGSTTISKNGATYTVAGSGTSSPSKSSAESAAKAAASQANAVTSANSKAKKSSAASTSPASTGYSATAAQNASVTGSGSSTAGVTAGYTPKGTYNDAELRAANQADQIDYWKNQYEVAKAAGDTAGMREAHAQAELIRAQQGYRGGDDGSEYIATPQNTGAVDWSVVYSNTPTQANYIDGVYVHPDDQKRLSQTDLNTLIALKKEYATATPERQKQINNQAELLRAEYGYSLGKSGNQFTLLTKPEEEKNALFQQAVMPYQAQTEAVNQVYDKLNDATLAQLLAAYNNSRAESEYQMGKIPGMYQKQRNAVSADNEREKMAYREQAAASGLNAGNRSQAALAFSNQLQNSLGQLNTAEANALADAQFALTQLYNNYQQQIATAVAQNNYQRAAELMNEMRTQQQSIADASIQQAQLNIQTSQLNEAIRQNNIAQQNVNRDYNLNLANSLSGIGSYGALGNLGGLSNNDVQALQRAYLVQQLGQYYPILRGYL